MRYKVLNTHPFLLPGIILTGINSDSFFRVENFEPSYPAVLVRRWKDDGFIEEAQEPIWTDSDMIKFAKECDNGIYGDHPGDSEYKGVLLNYKEEKGVK